ncbi:hypothetical protein OIU77_026205 [Salix suchowensis]|uniref:HMA domain-containing protein n=1 Tax=Salix suchowensis TaxID=1278906 RepID=A0ABQ9BYV6_9ROSI|nr:hypothetical protein OIU77_026205 [Salix suchowensis]
MMRIPCHLQARASASLIETSNSPSPLRNISAKPNTFNFTSPALTLRCSFEASSLNVGNSEYGKDLFTWYLNKSCGLKVETKDPEWHRTLTKVLKRIKGVSYAIDVEQGMAYIRGRVDPNKLLKKLSKGGKHADICWVETGNMNPYMNNGYQYPPPGAGYPQPGPGYHPGYAMASYYPKRPPPYSGYGYGYGYGLWL